MRCALDVLVVCSVMPKFQLSLCENVPVRDQDPNMIGMRFINKIDFILNYNIISFKGNFGCC